MTRLRVLVSRILGLFCVARRDIELNDEIQVHLDRLTEEYRRNGLSMDAARAAARRTFGGVTQTKERYRDQRGVPVLQTLIDDVRYAARVLWKSPAFTVVAVCTLALGIGANTAIFSAVDAVIMTPLPYRDPGQVVMVWEDASRIGFARNTPAPGNYVEWQRQTAVFAEMAATRGRTANLTVDGPAEQVTGRAVTASFFSLLGVQPVLGRAFTTTEDETGASVAIISYGLWQRRYAGDSTVIGRTIRLNGEPSTILGVMGRDFVFRRNDVDFWVPMHFVPADADDRRNHFLNVVARLKPGVTLEQARDDMQAVAARLNAAHPETNTNIGAVVVPMQEEALGTAQTSLLVLTAAAVSVLLIACANLAGLLLSRAAARRRELAVRSALGAPRARLVRQMVVEGLVLSVIGGVCATAVGSAGIAVTARLAPVGVVTPLRPALDLRMLGFTSLLSVCAGFLFSVVPAIQVTRESARDRSRHDGARVMGDERSRSMRDALVVLQVAAAVVLLVCAGLMLRTLANIRGVDVGFRTDRLLTLRTTLPTAKYRDLNQRFSFYDRVLTDVGALPGVQSAAYSSMLPFLSQGNTTGYRVEGRGNDRDAGGDALVRVGTARYLDALGVRIVAGRVFDDRDSAEAPPVVVINETLARTHWPRESPVGQRIAVGGTDVLRTIVGVVQDVRERGYDTEGKPGFYAPFAQTRGALPFPEYLLVRTSAAPADLATSIRRVLAAIDPEQPMSLVRTMDDIVALQVAERDDQKTLLLAFAGLALLLASLGIYGLLAYTVSQRTREIGMRVALGATAAHVVRLVVGRGLALASLGGVIGVGLAWGVTRAMQRLLYGVAPTDPQTFMLVVGVLAFVALAAAGLPALRALRVSPIAALRHE